MDGPTSPPSARPCTSRPAMTIAWAGQPMLPVEGVTASISMPSAIRPMVSTMAGLRPARSASAPMIAPPIGRIT